MGERKVVQKYIPPDFDPSLVPRGKKLSSKDGTVPVRMMLPFSLQCNTCHTFLYRGRKFNSKKEPMGGPDGVYLGIKRWRFHIKCTQCSRPITFLTDPKNADYEMENGGTRNFEITKDRKIRQEQAEQDQQEAEKLDPLKALEARVLDSQREMADLDNLEEIKAMNARHLQLLGAHDQQESFDADTQAVLRAQQKQELNQDGLTEQDEELVKSIQFGKKQADSIKRLTKQDEEQLEEQRKRRQAEMMDVSTRQDHIKPFTIAPIIRVKRKRVEAPPRPTESSSNTNGLANLLGGYESSDSD